MWYVCTYYVVFIVIVRYVVLLFTASKLLFCFYCCCGFNRWEETYALVGIWKLNHEKKLILKRKISSQTFSSILPSVRHFLFISVFLLLVKAGFEPTIAWSWGKQATTWAPPLTNWDRPMKGSSKDEGSIVAETVPRKIEAVQDKCAKKFQNRHYYTFWNVILVMEGI